MGVGYLWLFGVDIMMVRIFFSSLIFLYYRTVATVALLVLQYDGMSATVIDYKFYFI